MAGSQHPCRRAGRGGLGGGLRGASIMDAAAPSRKGGKGRGRKAKAAGKGEEEKQIAVATTKGGKKGGRKGAPARGTSADGSKGCHNKGKRKGRGKGKGANDQSSSSSTSSSDEDATTSSMICSQPEARIRLCIVLVCASTISSSIVDCSIRRFVAGTWEGS